MIAGILWGRSEKLPDYGGLYCTLLALYALSVDASAADKDIIDDGEAAFAADPFALAILQAAVGQYGSLVKPHAAAVLCFGQRNLVGVEELPHGPVDDLVGGMAEDVDNRV